jgi:TDG/mug DNA glycosylase family protein
MSATSHAATEGILPDVLAHDLRIVFCGTAAGTRSAQVGAYYAGPGNKFWRTLAAVGLTPRVLAPLEFRSLLDYRIGLTDINKTQSGGDSQLTRAGFDAARLRARIEHYAPRALAFNGKRSAAEFFGAPVRDYGRQPVTIGGTEVFVLPSTSGAASGFWNIAPWQALAAYVSS